MIGYLLNIYRIKYCIMKRLLFFIFLYVSFAFYSQTTKDDKIKEIDHLLEKANKAQLEVDLVNIIKHANTALLESKKIDYSKGKAYACMFIATGLYDLGKYKNALTYIEMGENEKFTKKNFILLAESQRIRGRVYAEIGLEKASFEAFRKGIKLSEKIPDKISRTRVQNLAYQNLVINYKLTKEYDSMYFYIKKSESALKSLDEKLVYQDLVVFYSDYGTYHALKNNIDSANYFFSKGINLANKYRFPYTSIFNTEKGKIELQKKQSDTALKYFFEALKNAQENKLQTDVIEIINLISKTYLQKGDSINSDIYKLKALNLEKELNKETKKASDFVVDKILKHDQKQHQEKKFLQTILIITTILLFILGSFHYITSKTNQKKISQNQEIIHIKEQEAKTLQKKINDSFPEIVTLAKEKNPEFLTRFQEVYPEFINKLLSINPNLRSSELTFCAYLFLNFSSKDIAEYTFTSTRTVQNRKNSIRKRLGISSKEDIYLWMKNL